ncbi:MAG: pyridoxamine 5'-phosphate oxidase family protein [Desulfobacteraceae bacterium]|nr:MAG: pyridoxamine 5'-phosphate oxidase family protein [Desulfobacteraceae bacterium]
MDQTQAIRNKIRQLFLGQKTAVLATHHDGQPYTSLVAFQGSGDLKHIFFVTPKQTRKFVNLSADPRVSILLTNSTNDDADFYEAIAVTATGRAAAIEGVRKEEALAAYLQKHPFLADFAGSPACAMVCVTVDSYSMVEKFQNVLELHMDA